MCREAKVMTKGSRGGRVGAECLSFRNMDEVQGFDLY